MQKVCIWEVSLQFFVHIRGHVKQRNHKRPQTSSGKVRSLLQTYNAVTTHTPKTLRLSSSLSHTHIVFTYTAACAVLSVLCVCSCGKNKKGREFKKKRGLIVDITCCVLIVYSIQKNVKELLKSKRKL